MILGVAVEKGWVPPGIFYETGDNLSGSLSVAP